MYMYRVVLQIGGGLPPLLVSKVLHEAGPAATALTWLATALPSCFSLWRNRQSSLPQVRYHSGTISLVASALIGRTLASGRSDLLASRLPSVLCRTHNAC